MFLNGQRVWWESRESLEGESKERSEIITKIKQICENPQDQEWRLVA